MNKAPGELFTSPFESFVWVYRQHMFYAILGMDTTASCIDVHSDTYATVIREFRGEFRTVKKNWLHHSWQELFVPLYNLFHQKFYYLIQQMIWSKMNIQYTYGACHSAFLTKTGYHLCQHHSSLCVYTFCQCNAAFLRQGLHFFPFVKTKFALVTVFTGTPRAFTTL